jgi:class 3 adenylate cyclase
MEEKKGNILLIDDDEDVLLAAKFILKRHFASITTANSPDLVDQLLKNNEFDVVLLDMNYSAGATSGQEGFELSRKINELSPSTRVVMMTAYGDIDLAIKAIKEGATDFIVKPWDNAKMVATVLAAYKKTVEIPATVKKRKEKELEDIGMSEEERIFMFLDITSSTAIAEQLGHVKYFELLNDFFKDIDEPIERNKGEIYQYVGDEVVVTWPLNLGVENANCLNCFFDIVSTVEKLSEEYIEKYDLIPNFKAGMHYGKVSTGTIGTLKKEIIYTGDVLNTTSRIEGLCNMHGVNVLLSEDLVNKLPRNQEYFPKRIGELILRGKSSKVTLYTFELNS